MTIYNGMDNSIRDIRVYKVKSKGDDYGRCKTEFVRTTKNNAEEYDYHKEVAPYDVPIIAKYFDIIDEEEESERDADSRFYGDY